MDRNEVLDRMTRMLPAEFEVLLFRLGVPTHLLPSSGAPLVTRAVAVVQYFEHPSRQWSALTEALGGGQPRGQAGAQTAGGQQGGGTHISVNIGGNASGLTIAGGNVISLGGSGD